MVNVTLQLPDELAEAAQDAGLLTTERVAAWLQSELENLGESDLDDEIPLEDTPDETILANFREAWRDALAGRTRPIEALFVELAAEDEVFDDNQD